MSLQVERLSAGKYREPLDSHYTHCVMVLQDPVFEYTTVDFLQEPRTTRVVLAHALPAKRELKEEIRRANQDGNLKIVNHH